MGLDIAFSRQAAEDAGMKYTLVRNGTKEEIDAALDIGDHDHAHWLRSYSDCYIIPGTDLVVEDGGDDEHIIVRANKWGRVYEPLTRWLNENSIPWVAG